MSFPIHQVSVDRVGAELRINEPAMSLAAGSAIQWIVTGVQRDETVELHAKAANPGELGPFTFTRQGQNVVWARGSSGAHGRFEYSLALYKLGTDRSSSNRVAASLPASFEVVSSGSPVLRSGQAILVSYDKLLEKLTVEQLETRLVPGDPLLFEFHLPENLFEEPWVPSIFFSGGAAEGRGYGPFSMLSVVAGGPADEAGLIRRFLVATGSSGLLGSFPYRAMVHSANGHSIVSSADPVLDNDGEVVCPGC